MRSRTAERRVGKQSQFSGVQFQYARAAPKSNPRFSSFQRARLTEAASVRERGRTPKLTLLSLRTHFFNVREFLASGLHHGILGRTLFLDAKIGKIYEAPHMTLTSPRLQHSTTKRLTHTAYLGRVSE